MASGSRPNRRGGSGCSLGGAAELVDEIVGAHGIIIPDNRDVIGDVFQSAAERVKATRAKGLVKSEVRLVTADKVSGGVDNGAVELKYIVIGHEVANRVEAHAEKALIFL